MGERKVFPLLEVKIATKTSRSVLTRFTQLEIKIPDIKSGRFLTGFTLIELLWQGGILKHNSVNDNPYTKGAFYEHIWNLTQWPAVPFRNLFIQQFHYSVESVIIASVGHVLSLLFDFLLKPV